MKSVIRNGLSVQYIVLGLAWLLVVAAPGGANAFEIKVGDILVTDWDKTWNVVKIDRATGQRTVFGQFLHPMDLALHPSGILYIGEYYGDIQMLHVATGAVTPIALSGDLPTAIWGLTLAPAGLLYVTGKDAGGIDSVFEVNLENGVSTVITQGNLLSSVAGIEMLDSTHLVVASTLNNRLLSISLADHSQSVIASGGMLDQPYDVAVHGTTLFTGTSDSRWLLKISGGNVTHVADLPGTPWGMDVDAAGNIIVGVKGAAGEVVVIAPDGTQLAAFSGPEFDWAAGLEIATTAVAAFPVRGRYLFYNNSAWDGNNPAGNTSDDNSIAFDKTALITGTASFNNYSSYHKGINGVMVDIAGLPGTLSQADFTFRVGNDSTPGAWASAPAPSSITVRAGAGLGGSHRVTLIWPDNAIQRQWLQVTVRATASTGLPHDDLFYFGNAIGETGNSTSEAQVNSTDVIATGMNPHFSINPAGIGDVYDFNRDKLVNSTDVNLARMNTTFSINALKLISVGATLAQAALAGPNPSDSAEPNLKLASAESFDHAPLASAHPKLRITRNLDRALTVVAHSLPAVGWQLEFCADLGAPVWEVADPPDSFGNGSSAWKIPASFQQRFFRVVASDGSDPQ